MWPSVVLRLVCFLLAAGLAGAGKLKASVAGTHVYIFFIKSLYCYYVVLLLFRVVSQRVFFCVHDPTQCEPARFSLAVC